MLSVLYERGVAEAEESQPKKWRQRLAGPAVQTMYKKVADKVRPVDVALDDGSKPGGDPDWRRKRRACQEARIAGLPKQKFVEYFEPRYDLRPIRFRVTETRWLGMYVPTSISLEEVELLKTVVMNREAVFA